MQTLILFANDWGYMRMDVAVEIAGIAIGLATIIWGGIGVAVGLRKEPSP